MDCILKYFPNLTGNQIDSFNKLQSLYIDWNAKINVISRKDIDNLYINHILHSLAIAKVVSFIDGTRIIDVGTGGGFPGIPLAIMFPDCSFKLVDSIGKKITVVNAVANALGLKNVEGVHTRVEQVTEKFDFVVSRAVTRLDTFYNMTRECVAPGGKNMITNGILYLKGGDFNDELKRVNRKTTIFNISDFFDEPFFETKKIVHLEM